MFLGEPLGQGWPQLYELALAFVLSALIGLEREIQQKSAGLRTYTLVGIASALIILISKYGFTDILEANRIVVDPSRIAAQIVSGIGFIGGGVIFVRKDIVRGLTTAATVWLTSAVGMACGAGLPILAVAVTCGHFIVIALFPFVEKRLPRSRWSLQRFRLSYQDGHGILRKILSICTQNDWSVTGIQIDTAPTRNGHQLGKQMGKEFMSPDEVDKGAVQASHMPEDSKEIVSVILEIRGLRSPTEIIAPLGAIEGVVGVQPHDGMSSSD